MIFFTQINIKIPKTFDNPQNHECFTFGRSNLENIYN